MTNKDNLITVLDPRGQPTGIFGRRLSAEAEPNDILDLDIQPIVTQESFQSFKMAPRLDKLEGKTIYLVDVGFVGGYEFKSVEPPSAGYSISDFVGFIFDGSAVNGHYQGFGTSLRLLDRIVHPSAFVGFELGHALVSVISRTGAGRTDTADKHKYCGQDTPNDNRS